MRSTPLFFSKFIETRNFATDFFEEYSKIKFHENTKKSNFMETLKNQISWKYQKSNFMKILKNQISWKYSKIKFHENIQKSNFMKILKNQISWKPVHSGSRVVPCWRTDRRTNARTDMTKLIDSFRDFASAPKKNLHSGNPPESQLNCKPISDNGNFPSRWNKVHSVFSSISFSFPLLSLHHFVDLVTSSITALVCTVAPAN